MQACHFTTVLLLPEVLLSFQQKLPRIELDIHVSGRLVNLVEEGIDVALRLGKLEDSSLITRLLMPCGLHACASPEYLKKYGKPEHPSELETHNCLIYNFDGCLVSLLKAQHVLRVKKVSVAGGCVNKQLHVQSSLP